MEHGHDRSYDINQIVRSTMALVLAGGRGSRLMQLTDWRAKPAAPFGGKYRIIDFPLSNCINSGLRRIGVITQYKAHSLILHIQRGWSFMRAELNEFVELLPASQRMGEELWYRGTSDAVHQNLDILLSHGPEYIVILGGDHVYKMDYTKMLADHVERGADVSVGCIEVPQEEASAFGVVDVDDSDRVVGWLEKPKDPPTIPGIPGISFASMGIYIFGAKFLYEQLERDTADESSSHDFGKDILPYLVPRYNVIAQRFSDSCVMHEGAQEHYWRDVGTVEAYWAANIDLTTVTPHLNLYDSRWPIWTYQEQLPPAKFVFDDNDRRGEAIDSLVASGCIVSGSTIRRSLISSDVRVNSYSQIEDSVVLPNVDVGRHCRLSRAIIDKGCVLPPGLVVGEDPELDAKRFYRTEKGITLITPTMLASESLHLAQVQVLLPEAGRDAKTALGE